MAVGTDSFPFRKCIIHNIQTRKIWYYFDTCLRVPFNRWEHSRGCWGCQAINLNDTRGLLQLELTVFLPKMHYTQYHQSSGQRVAYHFWVLWQLELTIMLPKMHYEQYPNSEKVVLFLYMPPSTLQPVGAQPGPSGPSDN